jgi:MFS family permease
MVIFLMPFYLMYPCGLPVDKVGLIMVIPFIFLFFVSPISGSISDTKGSRMLCTAGMAIVAVSLFALAKLAPEHSAFTIAWRLALTGLGTALFLPPNTSTAISAVSQNRRGVAAGTVATARNLGMVIGVALSGAVFNNSFHTLSGGLSLQGYRPGLAPIFMTSFRYTMTTGGVVAMVGVLLAFLRGPAKWITDTTSCD